MQGQVYVVSAMQKYYIEIIKISAPIPSYYPTSHCLNSMPICCTVAQNIDDFFPISSSADINRHELSHSM